jgi:hypothetical protein
MRVAIVFETDGTMRVVSEEPIEAFVVDESAPFDRVYKLSDSLEAGEELVTEVLGNDVWWASPPDYYM